MGDVVSGFGQMELFVDHILDVLPQDVSPPFDPLHSLKSLFGEVVFFLLEHIDCVASDLRQVDVAVFQKDVIELGCA